METKIASLKIKAAGPDDGLEDGQFVGYASVFGNVDSYGDIVEPGAFAKTIVDWQTKGDPIPVLWGHDFTDPFSNIGGVMTAEEDERGLKVTAQLDLDNPTAAQVYRLAKGRRVTDMSFAYDVLNATKEDDGNHLTELKLHEVSIVPIGANDQTDIVAIKAATASLAAKAGRVLSAKNEDALRSIRDQLSEASKTLSEVLSVVDSTDQEKASGEPKAKPDASDEEPTAAKSSASGEEPTAGPSVDHYLAVISIAQKGIEA